MVGIGIAEVLARLFGRLSMSGFRRGKEGVEDEEIGLQGGGLRCAARENYNFVGLRLFRPLWQ